MRQTVAVALLLAALVACGGTAANVSAASTHPAPSGFVVRPDISDPLCNGGHGVRLPTGLGGGPVVASGTMVDGSTLIALSPLYPGKRFAVLRSITRRCAPNGEFGSGGTAGITIPSRLRRVRPPACDPFCGLWVNVVASRKGGGAILAGAYGDGWVVGEITKRGRLDRTFGSGGWTALPFRGNVTAVLQEPSGRILIAGDNGGGGCCNRNWAAALSARGRLEHGFGKHGRTELPTGEDSGVAGLALEPNGDILAEVGYGNMGCWGVGLAMLTPSGRPVPRFEQRLGRFWRRLGFSAFVGDAVVDGDGFTLVGTGQKPCYGNSPASSATGLLARFRADGRRAGRTIRFPSRLFGDGQAFRVRDDIFDIESPYADSSRLTVTARRRDGSVDPRFGTRGRVRIHAPWSGPNSGLVTVLVNRAGPSAIALVATRSGYNQLQIIRVRL